jgi:trehalose 6-phosphate synthase
MILSEFAGAAQSLNGSIVVNPWDSQQVADAIHEAVTMDADTRAENHRKLFKVRAAVCARRRRGRG